MPNDERQANPVTVDQDEVEKLHFVVADFSNSKLQIDTQRTQKDGTEATDTMDDASSTLSELSTFSEVSASHQSTKSRSSTGSDTIKRLEQAEDKTNLMEKGRQLMRAWKEEFRILQKRRMSRARNGESKRCSVKP